LGDFRALVKPVKQSSSSKARRRQYRSDGYVPDGRGDADVESGSVGVLVLKEGGNATGKNTFGTGFEDESLRQHHEKRQREGHYTNLTEEQYEERALSLLQQEVGGDIDGYETNDGKVVKWNKKNQDYATGTSGKNIKTLMPLRGGQASPDIS